MHKMWCTNLQAFIYRTTVNAITAVRLTIWWRVTFCSCPFALANTCWMSWLWIQLANGAVFTEINTRIVWSNIDLIKWTNLCFQLVEADYENGLSRITWQFCPVNCAVQLQYASFLITWQVPPLSHENPSQSLNICALSRYVSHRMPE